MSYYRIIFEKKNYLYLVCVINGVINYSVDKTVIVNLNLNEYCLPVPYQWEYYVRLQNGGFRD